MGFGVEGLRVEGLRVEGWKLRVWGDVESEKDVES